MLLDGDNVQQTSYILQFLWRDLTSPLDIVGPYFTCPKTIESKFVISCVFETIKLFHLYGLNTFAHGSLFKTLSTFAAVTFPILGVN